MKPSKLKALIYGMWASVICLGLIVAALFTYYGVWPIQIPLIPTAGVAQVITTPTASFEHTFEAGGLTEWNTDMGLKISIPPMQSGRKMQFTVEPSAPQQQPEGEFVLIHSVYDISLTAENVQETPPITYSFEIPDGVEPQAAVILYWTEEGWTLADNESGTPGGEVSSDGKYILIIYKGASRYSIAEWLYVKILSHLDGLPNPPPPDPIIEVEETKPSTDYPGCYTPPGCLVSEVSVESPIYKDIPLLGKFGATWYSIEIAATENVSISGPDLLGFSPYLDPGEKQDLRIAFPYAGGQAHLCLDTSKALGWAAKTWAEDLFILPDVLSNSSFVVEIIERFQGKQATIKDMWWVIKKVLIDKFWKLTGNKVKFVANVVPVSINIAVYINGWIDRGVPCVDITATPPPSDRIAFVSDRDGNQEIYLMELVGTTVVNLTNLTNNPADDYDPVWSPDGTRIAFVSERDGNPEIYVLNSNDSSITRLTYDSGNDYDVAWSQDSNHIAFVSDHEGKNEIYVIAPDGSNRVNITDNLGGASPSWSPNGKFIVFSSDRDFPCMYGTCQPGIYKVRLDTAEVTLVFKCPLGVCASCFDFVWSSDDRNIMFTRISGDADSVFYDTYSLNLDDQNIKLVVSGGDDFYDRPYDFAWSPDLSHVAFARCYDCDRYTIEDFIFNYKGYYDEIVVINADGSNETRLTNNSSWDRSPAWSPDSKKIAFVSAHDGNKEIYSMNADGSNQVNLTNNSANDTSPAWAPVP